MADNVIPMGTMERWCPRCPRCGASILILGPANQHTRQLIATLDIYCPNCDWAGSLGGNLKQLYVRV